MCIRPIECATFAIEGRATETFLELWTSIPDGRRREANYSQQTNEVIFQHKTAKQAAIANARKRRLKMVHANQNASATLSRLPTVILGTHVFIQLKLLPCEFQSKTAWIKL